jgi:hypothetical protein
MKEMRVPPEFIRPLMIFFIKFPNKVRRPLSKKRGGKNIVCT